MPYVRINSQFLNPCETGGVIRCGLQIRLDMGPHGVPRGSSLAGQAQDSGFLEVKLVPLGACTERFCSMKDTICQVRSRYCQRRIVPPDPHRNPGTRCADHLHHHASVTLSDSAHNSGSQRSDHRTLCRAPDHTHAERQKSDGNHPNQRADHTDHNDQATQSSSK